MSTRPSLTGAVSATAFLVALTVACAEAPLQPDLARTNTVAAKAKPPSCPSQINVTVGGLSGSLTSDGGDYPAYTHNANGNLAFVTTTRTVTVTTSLGSAPQVIKSYTNNHEQVCGLSGMAATGSSGTAVFEVEWRDPNNRYILRYGKNCVGEFGTVVPANKIATTRNANVWTLTGAAGTGVLCRGRPNGKPNWIQVGTADGFTMTLTGS